MATKRGGQQPSVVLDWFNVSYRSIVLAVVTLVAAGGIGSYYAWLKLVYAGSPRAEARESIDQAEDALERAGPATGQGNTIELKQTAQRLLAEARRQYDASNYQDARKAATESKLSAEKAIAIERGESAREVQFYRIEGDVKVKRVRELTWRSAESGMSLQTGDQVKTSSRASAQIIYFNGTITTIKPGSLLEIKELYDNPATRVQQIKERLREGRILASTQEPVAEGSFHEVTTQTTSARAADRSEFEVAFDRAQEKTEVQVTAGEATVSAGSGPALKVGAFEKLHVDGQSKVSEVQRVKLPPTMLSPMDQKVYVRKDNVSPPVELSWEPSEEAISYRLQIAVAPLFAEPTVDLGDLGNTAVTLPNLQEGGYYWRVAAQYTDGSSSDFSPARRFKMMSARLAQTGDTIPPMLEIDDFLVFASQVIVRGKTEPGSLLTVMGRKVDVYDDGSFTTVVTLKHEGLNRIPFVAQDLAGNETKIEKPATVDPY